MSEQSTRRDFLRGATGAGLYVAGIRTAQAQDHKHERDGHKSHPPAHPPQQHAHLPVDEQNFDGFSRYRPSRGRSPDSDYYLGKSVPGRGTGDGTFVAPDLPKLPYEMIDGWKVFQLIAQHVRRELLPGYAMDFYGYNGSMPGPTIEAVEGDRVRVIVRNELPEPTTVHWHGP
jgi:manganese oxidase